MGPGFEAVDETTTGTSLGSCDRAQRHEGDGHDRDDRGVQPVDEHGGVLRLRDLVFSCAPRDVEHVIEAWLAAAPSRPEDGWTRPELEAHVRQEHSTFNRLLEAMLEHAGFQIQQVEYDTSRIYAAYMCVKG